MARDFLTGAELETRELGALLDREEKDRPPANRRYRAASDSLNEFEFAAGPGSESIDWDRRLDRLGGRRRVTRP